MSTLSEEAREFFREKGRKGGRKARGEKKIRGDSEYYRRIVKKRWDKEKKKKEEKKDTNNF